MLVSDTVLAIKVKRALQASPDLEGCDLRVHIQDGVVTLEGYVPDERLRTQAGDLTEGVFGVDEVDNRLMVS